MKATAVGVCNPNKVVLLSVLAATTVLLLVGVFCVWSSTTPTSSTQPVLLMDEGGEAAERAAQRDAARREQEELVKASEQDAERTEQEAAAATAKKNAAEDALKQMQQDMEEGAATQAQKKALDDAEQTLREETEKETAAKTADEAAQNAKAEAKAKLSREGADAGGEAADAAGGEAAGEGAAGGDETDLSAGEKDAVVSEELGDEVSKFTEEGGVDEASEEQVQNAKEAADNDEINEDPNNATEKAESSWGPKKTKFLAAIVLLAGISVGMAMYLADKYSGCYYTGPDGKSHKCAGTSKNTASSACNGHTCVFCEYDQQYAGHYWVHAATSTSTATSGTSVINRYVNYSEGCMAKSQAECPPPNHLLPVPGGGNVCSSSTTLPSNDAYLTRTCNPPSLPQNNPQSLNELNMLCKQAQYTGLNKTKIGTPLWYESKGKGLNATFKAMPKGSGAQQWVMKMNSGKKGCMQYGGIWNQAGCIVGNTIDNKATSASECAKAGGTWVGNGFVCVTKDGISKGITSATKCKSAGGTWGMSAGKKVCSFTCGLVHWGNDLKDAGVDIEKAAEDIAKDLWAFLGFGWVTWLIIGGGVIATIAIVAAIAKHLNNNAKVVPHTPQNYAQPLTYTGLQTTGLVMAAESSPGLVGAAL